MPVYYIDNLWEDYNDDNNIDNNGADDNDMRENGVTKNVKDKWKYNMGTSWRTLF